MLFKSLTLLSHSNLSLLQCVFSKCLNWFCHFLLSFSFFFPGPPRLTVEILCCSAKAPHLRVITSHPSLRRLPGVEPSHALHAPLPHHIPSPPPADMWSLQQLCWVHPELYTWSWWVRLVCEHCCCCDACRLLLAVPWVAQPADTSSHNATFTRALTLPCLQEGTGRPCLNRMHLVCLPAQGQGQLATWLLCHTGLTYGWACHCYNKGSALALCVQEKGHILSEYLQYAPSDSLCSWIEWDGEVVTTRSTHPALWIFYVLFCNIHTSRTMTTECCLVDL